MLAAALETPGLTASLTVVGSCMEPYLRSGDRITVAAPGPSIGPGDVVLCRSRETLVCHRVIRVREQIAVGSDASSGSETLSRDALVGRVIAIRRDGRLRWLGAGRPPLRDRALAWAERLFRCFADSVALGNARPLAAAAARAFRGWLANW
jgi:hypothetical protein